MIVAISFKPDAGAYCKQIVIHGTSTSSADWDFSVKAYMMRFRVQKLSQLKESALKLSNTTSQLLWIDEKDCSCDGTDISTERGM
ncbi:hypothetical protein KY289_012230 [Solanum tuberosum]|nr:hypothetical protein KY289_012230 [Solanum tuberosum]